MFRATPVCCRTDTPEAEQDALKQKSAISRGKSGSRLLSFVQKVERDDKRKGVFYPTKITKKSEPLLEACNEKSEKGTKNKVIF